MTIELPAPVAGYFNADNNGNADAVAAWFTHDAIVRDEGKENRGRDAIQAWKRKSTQAYRYSAEPFAVTSDGERTIITSHVSGDFPGSPVDLRYAFALREDKIAALEILS
jgi:hypothetical protein